MQEFITYIKKNFNDKIVLEIPKNKPMRYVITTILKLIGNKKVVLISEEKRIIQTITNDENIQFILFFNDENVTLPYNEFKNSYWVLKKTFESNFEKSTCLICLQEHEINLTKLMCCGACFCIDCYKIFVNDVKYGKISPTCPMCRTKIIE